MAGPIYTKKGDKGKTSLFDGTKVSKNSLRIEAVGSIDELNSVIGICITFVKDKKIVKELEIIQNDLFEIGGGLAFPYAVPVDFLPERISEFETMIDNFTVKLPILSDFILPGGVGGGAFLHLARTVCRRGERVCVDLSQKEKADPNILIYLNRLSDLLFTFARFENFKQRKKDKIWRKR